jgi:proline racemase
VVYFDDVGTIGMCGHGTIGVVRTLEYLGRLRPGVVRIDTPVGTVSAELHADGAVTVMNIPASVAALDVTVEVPPVGTVTGAIAWTGNWFFLTDFTRDWNPRTGVRGLTQIAMAIRHALRAQGITGRDGARIDHIELALRPTRPDADARNFVLCPGAAYDRSPCGTGTAALMAVRHARGQLALGERWRQESITGSLFTGWLEQRGDDLIPFIRGHAFIMGEATLRFDALDPFRWGLPAGEG